MRRTATATGSTGRHSLARPRARNRRSLRPRRIRPLLLSVVILSGVFAAVGPDGSPAGATTGPPARPITMLAAGDAYSAGLGLPGASGECAQPAAGSSSQNYAQVAANGATAPVTISRPIVVSACADATLGDLSSTDTGPGAQWNASLGRFDLVSFTFGADDVDFADLIQRCIGLDVTASATATSDGASSAVSGGLQPSDPGHLCPREAQVRQNITTDVADKYGAFLTDVATSILTPGGNVVVLGYPELIEDPTRWQGLSKALGLCMGIGPQDANEIRALLSALNSAISTAVTNADAAHVNGVHFTFINVNQGGGAISSSDARLFEPSKGARHNLCSGSSWINGLVAANAGAASFHPTQQAHDAEGSILAGVIATQLDWSGLDLLPSTAGPTPVASPGPSPSPGAHTPTPTPTTTVTTPTAPGSPGVPVSTPPAYQPNPTPRPTSAPTPRPTAVPATPAPTAVPTVVPTDVPTDSPSPDPGTIGGLLGGVLGSL